MDELTPIKEQLDELNRQLETSLKTLEQLSLIRENFEFMATRKDELIETFSSIEAKWQAIQETALRQQAQLQSLIDQHQEVPTSSPVDAQVLLALDAKVKKLASQVMRLLNYEKQMQIWSIVNLVVAILLIVTMIGGIVFMTLR